MASTLRWGLLGTARINRSVIPPLKNSPRNTLAAVASRDDGRARAYAEQWDIPRAFGSYEELLADPGIEVVYISLPNSLHAGWMIKALQAGKHVLCEKPLATTLEDVDAVIQAARQTGNQVAEAFMYRHHPQTLKVAEMVKSGVLGKILLMRGSFTFSLTDPENIRNNAALHGGSLWDIGCYPISYARTMAGMEPEEVFGWQITGASGIDRTFSGELRFPGSILAQIQSSFNTPDFSRFEIFGEKGHLIIPTPFKPDRHETVILSHQGNVESVLIDSGDLYEGEIENMADTILHGRPPRITLADSRANVATILALLESARVGRAVKNPPNPA